MRLIFLVIYLVAYCRDIWMKGMKTSKVFVTFLRTFCLYFCVFSCIFFSIGHHAFTFTNIPNIQIYSLTSSLNTHTEYRISISYRSKRVAFPHSEKYFLANLSQRLTVEQGGKRRTARSFPTAILSY